MKEKETKFQKWATYIARFGLIVAVLMWASVGVVHVVRKDTKINYRQLEEAKQGLIQQDADQSSDQRAEQRRTEKIERQRDAEAKELEAQLKEDTRLLRRSLE